MTQLDKDLLKLNNEINGKSKSQIKTLISKKYKKAKDNLSKILSSDEMTAVQNLNDSLMEILTDELIGTHGHIGTHGVIETKRAKSSIIVVPGSK